VKDCLQKLAKLATKQMFCGQSKTRIILKKEIFFAKKRNFRKIFKFLGLFPRLFFR
jgi:hypothetical protein